jgi:hypothetical protein
MNPLEAEPVPKVPRPLMDLIQELEVVERDLRLTRPVDSQARLRSINTGLQTFVNELATRGFCPNGYQLVHVYQPESGDPAAEGIAAARAASPRDTHHAQYQDVARAMQKRAESLGLSYDSDDPYDDVPLVLLSSEVLESLDSIYTANIIDWTCEAKDLKRSDQTPIFEMIGQTLVLRQELNSILVKRGERE